MFNQTNETNQINKTNQNHQPVFALRNNTERPETITIGTNELIGTDPSKLPPVLEKLSGSRHGQMSIRINDQWRICFIWKDGNAIESFNQLIGGRK